MTRQSSKVVVGNWKMHGRLAENAALLAAVANGAATLSVQVGMGVCVPYPYLAQAEATLQGSRVMWGAQDISAFTHGAYTGEVSAGMAAEFGASLAIVGHSERRTHHGERPEVVGAKAAQALQAGLRPVVCVGETLEERDGGRMHAVVCAQLGAVLDALSPAQVGRIIVAYEPVWAIGTGRCASAGQAQEAHALLRDVLARHGGADVPLLYGGSVKPDNAEALFGQPDIDGGLIGGASLSAADFIAICKAAQAVLAGRAVLQTH
jgi:triosephosphate isomerase